MLAALSACQNPSPDNTTGPDLKTQDINSLKCNILVDYVSRQFDMRGEKLILSDEGSRIVFGDTIAFELANFGRNPRTARPTEHHKRMAQALIELSEKNAIRPTHECDALAELKATRSYKPTAAYKEQAKSEELLVLPYTVLSVQMPIVDSAAREAIFDTSTYCGPLCASGQLIKYTQNPDGVWVYAGATETWMS